jgi:plastocyanin
VTDDDEVSEPVEHVIEILDGNEFSPDEITIAPGDTVTWVNLTDQVHTSSADPEIATDPSHVQLPEGAETWHSGNIEPDEEYSITFDIPGVYIYFCYPHQDAGMIGTIIVEAEDEEDADRDDDEQMTDDSATDDAADDGVSDDSDTATDGDVSDDSDTATDDVGTDDTDTADEYTGVGGDRQYNGKDSVN